MPGKGAQALHTLRGELALLVPAFTGKGEGRASLSAAPGACLEPIEHAEGFLERKILSGCLERQRLAELQRRRGSGGICASSVRAAVLRLV